MIYPNINRESHVIHINNFLEAVGINCSFFDFDELPLGVPQENRGLSYHTLSIMKCFYYFRLLLQFYNLSLASCILLIIN